MQVNSHLLMEKLPTQSGLFTSLKLISTTLSKCIAWCLLAIPTNGNAQYLNNLYDFNTDSLRQCAEVPGNIFIRPDGSYFVTGQAVCTPFNKYFLFTMIISADGSQVVKRNSIGYGSYTTNYYQGLNSPANRAATGYVSPYGFGAPWVTSGICLYDEQGDTVFTRTYTDTSIYNDAGMQAIMLSDSSFMVVGERDTAVAGSKLAYAYLEHVSKAGTLLWVKTYMKDTSGQNRFTSIDVLKDGKLLVGGTIIRHVFVTPSRGFRFSQPWFTVVDTMGNILRDTLYGKEYLGGGNIFVDKNAGYYHWGIKDSVPAPFLSQPAHDINRPYYLAHQDTNFNVIWRQSFVHYPQNFSRIWHVTQTVDSGYLVMGERNGPYINGWAARLDKHGNLKWERPYWQDSSRNGYLVDGEQRADGSFVMVGWTQACATCSQDVWIVGVDSNGCEIPGCSYTVSIPAGPDRLEEFVLYPNPSNGAFTVEAPGEGKLVLFSMQGMRVAEYDMPKGKKVLSVPATLSAGIYMGQYTSSDGKASKTIRLVYQP